MILTTLKGKINEHGQLELDEPLDLPPGEVFVTIEMMDEAEEEADEAEWDAQFAKSQDFLRKKAREVREQRKAGLTEPFDPDTDTL